MTTIGGLLMTSFTQMAGVSAANGATMLFNVQSLVRDHPDGDLLKLAADHK